MICDKCGGETQSFKKLSGKKHVSGSSPDIFVHVENWLQGCPGTVVKSPVLTEFYYASQEEYDAARAGDEGAKFVAQERATQERMRWQQQRAERKKKDKK